MKPRCQYLNHDGLQCIREAKFYIKTHADHECYDYDTLPWVVTLLCEHHAKGHSDKVALAETGCNVYCTLASDSSGNVGSTIPKYVCACGFETDNVEDAKKHWVEHEYHFWLIYDGRTPTLSSIDISLELVGKDAPGYTAELEKEKTEYIAKLKAMSKQEIINLARKECIESGLD